MSPTLRLEVYESEGPAREDLAREAWLLERAAQGEVSLFLTSWEGPVVVLGYGQPSEDADLEWCRSRKIPVLRRLTGGTGVVHRGDLGVGLALPQDHEWGRGIVGLYDRFLGALEPALQSVGGSASRIAEPKRATRVRSPICFLDQLSDTLVVDGKKAVGCAQTRRRNAVLIHAEVLLGLDAGLYSRVFGISEEIVRSGLAPAISGVGWRDVGEAVVSGFSTALDLIPSRPSPVPVPDEYREPYSSPHWSPGLTPTRG